MSKISLKPNASGTGVFSLEAPNSNVDRTLNLPDEAGTVLTNVSDIETQVKTATNATGSAPVYACRAWVNFDGTGTVSIRESGNVSSITDNGTGNYDINFTTAMPDATFSVVGMVGESTKFTSRNDILTGAPVNNSSCYVSSFTSNSSAKDSPFISVAIFR